jgi:hypothetical protein
MARRVLPRSPSALTWPRGGGGARQVEQFGKGAVVLEFESKKLAGRHVQLLANGVKSA